MRIKQEPVSSLGVQRVITEILDYVSFVVMHWSQTVTKDIPKYLLYVALKWLASVSQRSWFE
jgi:hypothetical protein